MTGRVQAGAEPPITGGYADGSGASATAPDEGNSPVMDLAGVAAELDRLIEANAMPDLALLERRFAPVPGRVPDVTVTLPSPALYDALLIAGRHA